MKSKKWQQIILTLTWVFASFTAVEPTRAVGKSPMQSELNFNLPPVGAPGNRRSHAGTRGCETTEQPLIALMPPTNIGLTISERPTLWFYLPYSSTTALNAEFLLLNDESKAVYQTTMVIEKTPGVVSVPIPKTVLPLESDKRYQWVLSVICNPADRTADDFVKGQVMRKESLQAEVEEQLGTGANGRDRVMAYGEHGLWYDAMTTLAELDRQAPQNGTYSDDWACLLEQVGLGEIAKEPIIDCCTSSD